MEDQHEVTLFFFTVCKKIFLFDNCSKNVKCLSRELMSFHMKLNYSSHLNLRKKLIGK